MISDKYILVGPLPKEEKAGFTTVEVQDNFVYKGVVLELPAMPVYIGNHTLAEGETVLFAKYSPDTHEVEGKKFVRIDDLLKVL